MRQCNQTFKTLLMGLGASALMLPASAQTRDWVFKYGNLNTATGVASVNGFTGDDWHAQAPFAGQHSETIYGTVPGAGSNYYPYDANGFIADASYQELYTPQPKEVQQLIFAVPGKCNQFYGMYVYVSHQSGVGGNSLQPLDFSNAGQVNGITSGTPQGISNSPLPFVAVSPLNNTTGTTRKIYTLNYVTNQGNEILMRTIDPNGNISGQTSIAQNLPEAGGAGQIRLSPNGRYLFWAYCTNGGQRTAIYRYDLATSTLKTLVSTSNFEVSGIAFEPSGGTGGAGRLLASGHTVSGALAGGIVCYDLGGAALAGSGVYSDNLGGTTTGVTTLTSNANLGFTEMERGQNGSFYCGETSNNMTSSISAIGDGILNVITPTSSGFNGPVQVSPTITGLIQMSGNGNNPHFFIQSQVDGEDYNQYYFNNTSAFDFTFGNIAPNGQYITTLYGCDNYGYSGFFNYYVPSNIFSLHITKGHLNANNYYVSDGTLYDNGSMPGNSFSLSDSKFKGLFDDVTYIAITIVVKDACGLKHTAVRIFELKSVKAFVTFYMNAPVDSAGGCNPASPCNIIDPSNPFYDGLQPIYNPSPASSTPPSFTNVAQPITGGIPPNIPGWSGDGSVGFNKALVTPATGTSITLSAYSVKVDEYSASGSFIQTVLNQSPGNFGNTSYKFNLNSNPQQYYFGINYNTIKNNNIYRVTLSVNTSNCGVISQSSWFKILDGGPAGGSNAPTYWRHMLPGSSTAVQQQLVVFPNPAHDRFTISWNCDQEQPTEATIVLIDVLGKKVLSRPLPQTAGDNKVEVNCSGLVPGIYYYNISASGRTTTGTISVK